MKGRICGALVYSSAAINTDINIMNERVCGAQVHVQFGCYKHRRKLVGVHSCVKLKPSPYLFKLSLELYIVILHDGISPLHVQKLMLMWGKLWCHAMKI